MLHKNIFKHNFLKIYNTYVYTVEYLWMFRFSRFLEIYPVLVLIILFRCRDWTSQIRKQYSYCRVTSFWWKFYYFWSDIRTFKSIQKRIILGTFPWICKAPKVRYRNIDSSTLLLNIWKSVELVKTILGVTWVLAHLMHVLSLVLPYVFLFSFIICLPLRGRI